MKNLIIAWLAILLFCILLPFNSIYSQKPDKTWLVDVTQAVGLQDVKGSRIWIADINNDNYPDLLWGGDVGMIKNHIRVMLNVENPDKNSPNKRIFVDFTEESGIAKSRNSNNSNRITDVASLADVNNDGNIDLVTSIYYHRLQMYDDDPGDRTEVLLNDGTGHFTMVPNNGLHDFAFVDTLPRGLINCTGIAFLDYDYDGNIDIYFSTWFIDYAANLAGLGEYKMKDFLFKGNGDGSFTNISNSGIERVAEPMYGVNVTDWNNDGWQDILTSPYCRSGGSLFCNNKNGTFTDVARDVGYNAHTMQGDNGQNLCQWEANPGDYNNDGYMDLLQDFVHGGYDNYEGRTTIVTNLGEENGYRLRWDLDRIRRDAPKNSHLGDQGSQFFDLNGDGLLDVCIGQMAYPDANIYGQERLYICMQNDTGYFDDISKAIGVYDFKEAHSMEPVDFDLDGDQDLFFSHQVRDTVKINGKDTILVYMRISLLRNDIGNKRTWTSTKLTASKGTNQSSLGARIKVFSRHKTQMQEIQAGLGHCTNQQSFIRNFGLGDDNYIDSIVVRFPNKNLNTKTIVNPPTNLLLDINESGDFDYIKTWEGDKPVIAFNLQKLDFDTVDVNSYKSKTLKIKNIGNADLVINSIDLVGQDKNFFGLITPGLPVNILPGKDISISVRFTPNIRRHFDAFLNIVSNAVNKANRNYDVFGFGFEQKPIMEVTKDYIIMDSAWIDSTDIKTFEIMNTGEVPLSVSSINFKNDFNGVFAVPGLTVPFDIPAKSSQMVSIIFKPKEIIHYETQLEITSNGYNKQSHNIKVFGTCNGPFPNISVSHKMILFGNVNVGSYKDMSFNISNIGNADLHVTEASIKDNGSEFYKFQNITIPFVIAANSSQEAVIRFTPQEVKSYVYQLKLVSNSLTDSEIMINLRGSGVKPDLVDENIAKEEQLSIIVAPNPASNVINLKLNLESTSAQDIQLILTDICGCTTETVINKRIIPGDNVVNINTSALPSGKYHLVVYMKNRAFQKPVVIVR